MTGSAMVDYIRQTYIDPLSSRLRDTLESLSFLARPRKNLVGNDKEEDGYVNGKSFLLHTKRMPIHERLYIGVEGEKGGRDLGLDTLTWCITVTARVAF